MAAPKKPRIGRPPINPADRKKTVGFRLHPDTIESLSQIAKLRGESIAAVLAALIEREVVRLKKKR